MEMPNFSQKRADIISNGAFLISLGILFFTNGWWPGILLALWVTLGLREFLTGRWYDLIVTSIILLGLFFISVFKLDWIVIVPIIFILGGIYIICREFFTQEEDIEEKMKEAENHDNDINRK